MTVLLENTRQLVHHRVHCASQGRTLLLTGQPMAARVVRLESIQQLKVQHQLTFASTVQIGM
jgi:hypothetical protein